jgi:hypothetical protein
MFIGETFFPPESLNSKPLTALSVKDITQLIFMGIGLVGFVMAWKWELAGGIISLVCYVGLGIINPGIFSSPFFIYIVTAVLFIAVGIMRRNAKTSHA